MDTQNINIEKNEKPQKSLVIILIIISVFILSLMGGAFFALAQDKDVIISGVKINGVDVSGLPKDIAQKELQQNFNKQYRNAKLTLSFQDQTWEIGLEAIDGKPDYAAAVEKAYAFGHHGNIIEQLLQRYHMRKNTENIPISLQYSEEKVSDILTSIKDTIESPSQNAAILFENGNIILQPEKIGQTLVQKEILQKINDSLKQFPFQPIVLSVIEDHPAITAELLKDVTDVLGKYSTKFDSANVARSHNVAVAAKAINNTCVKPGQIFSFNKVVGPRLKKNGYAEAPVIINNELVPGIGGGVCQVSSTLFNSVLYGNLAIKKRSNHSLAVGYVPLGQDATVADGGIDFQFVNSNAYPIYIKTSVQGNRIIVWVLGRKERPERKVQILSEVIETIQPEIIKHEDGSLTEGTVIKEKVEKTGYKVRTYRVVKENGKIINREVVANSFYRPVNGIYRVGTKKVDHIKPVQPDDSEQENDETNPENDEINPEDGITPEL